MMQYKKLRDRWYYLIFIASSGFGTLLICFIAQLHSDIMFYIAIWCFSTLVGSVLAIPTAIYAILFKYDNDEAFNPIKWMLSTILFGTVAAFTLGAIIGNEVIGSGLIFAVFGFVAALLSTSTIRLLEWRLNRTH